MSSPLDNLAGGVGLEPPHESDAQNGEKATGSRGNLNNANSIASGSANSITNGSANSSANDRNTSNMNTNVSKRTDAESTPPQSEANSTDANPTPATMAATMSPVSPNPTSDPHIVTHSPPSIPAYIPPYIPPHTEQKNRHKLAATLLQRHALVLDALGKNPRIQIRLLELFMNHRRSSYLAFFGYFWVCSIAMPVFVDQMKVRNSSSPHSNYQCHYFQIQLSGQKLKKFSLKIQGEETQGHD
jgi:hypothetical protein